MLERLIKIDAKDARRSGTAFEEKLFLYSLIRLTAPQLVIEIGVYYGHSTAWIAKALRDNGKGRLIAVDNWKGTSQDSEIPGRDKTVKKRLEALSLSDVVEVVTADSAEFLQQQAAKSADIVWIDGCHKYEAALTDIKWALKAARRLVVVHDTRQEGVAQACAHIGGGTWIPGRRGFWLRSLP